MLKKHFGCCLSSFCDRDVYPDKYPKYEKSTENCMKLFLNRFFNKNKYYHCNETSGHKPPYIKGVKKSWIQFYKFVLIMRKRLTILEVEEISRVCSFKGCDRLSEVGAHIRKSCSFEKSCDWYITPSCKNCNNKRGLGCKLKKGTYIVKVSKGSLFEERKNLVCDKKRFNRKDRNLMLLKCLKRVKIKVV